MPVLPGKGMNATQYLLQVKKRPYTEKFSIRTLFLFVALDQNLWFQSLVKYYFQA